MSRSPTHSSQPKPPVEPSRLPWWRIVIFLSVFTVLLAGANAAVWTTAGHFFDLERKGAWPWISASIVLAFIPATVIGRFYSGLPLRVIYGVTAVSLGFLNYAFFAALACWLLKAVVALGRLPVSPVAIGCFCFGLGVVAAFYGLGNALWIRTTRMTVTLENLPAVWENRTAVLVSDVHLGHVNGPFFLRRLIARLRRLAPDIVLISGDVFDGTIDGIDRLVAPWAEYNAPLGIYFVTGNHDEFHARQIYLDALIKVGIRVLNNEKVVIDGLQLLGVHDREASEPGPYRATLRDMEIDRDRPSVLLVHQPANLQIAADEGVSLQLSGHTHRGQMWPWTMIVKRVYRQFAYGLNRLGKLQVYTSSGVGTWGPPLRLGTRSEIVLFTLR